MRMGAIPACAFNLSKVHCNDEHALYKTPQMNVLVLKWNIQTEYSFLQKAPK